jgi:hypothetical protein
MKKMFNLEGCRDINNKEYMVQENILGLVND